MEIRDGWSSEGSHAVRASSRAVVSVEVGILLGSYAHADAASTGLLSLAEAADLYLAGDSNVVAVRKR
jgi:hypothetical protein